MERIINTPDACLYLGRAEDWPNIEYVDLVLTNPYGPLPIGLQKTPMVIHQWEHRQSDAEKWCGNRLDYRIGTWNRGREAFWAARFAPRVPPNVYLDDLVPEKAGWYPEDLVRRICEKYVKPGMVVWDGFMGRGTVGKFVRAAGARYIGVEQLPEHMALAREFLNV